LETQNVEKTRLLGDQELKFSRNQLEALTGKLELLEKESRRLETENGILRDQVEKGK